MIDEWAEMIGCSKPWPNYRNDGSTIADWSHLLLSRSEFEAALRESDLHSCAGLPEHVTSYVYDSEDLNRFAYEDIITELRGITDVELVRVCAFASLSL